MVYGSEIFVCLQFTVRKVVVVEKEEEVVKNKKKQNRALYFPVSEKHQREYGTTLSCHNRDFSRPGLNYQDISKIRRQLFTNVSNLNAQVTTVQV